MKVLSRYNIKEVILHLAEELDLDDWSTSSDLQIYLQCGEILEVQYFGCSWDDEYMYEYRIKYMELAI